jgi:hypothetical protein
MWINVEQQRGVEGKRHILYSKLNIVRAVCVERVADMRNAHNTGFTTSKEKITCGMYMQMLG